MEIDDVVWDGEYDGESFELLVENDVLLGCHWPCKEGSPKYVILYMHGLCSAVTFNANVLRIFSDHGGASLACDHRGHGRSPGNRSQTTIPLLIQEITQLILYAKLRYPDIPIFLFGHSLGGLASLCFCHRRPCASSLLKGVIITAPWLKAAKFPNPSIWIRMGLAIGSRIAPNFGINTGLDVSKSTYPQKYKDLVSKSSYMLVKASPLLINSVLPNMEYISSNPCQFPREMPILFMQGTSDKLVDLNTNVEWAKVVCSNNNCEDSELILYEGAPHDIMKSFARGDAFRSMFSYIEKLCSIKIH